MTTESSGAAETKHYLGGDFSFEWIFQPDIGQPVGFSSTQQCSLSSQLMQNAPGIDIGLEVRQLQYMHPREVGMFLYSPRDESLKLVANYKNPFGNAIRANIFFERTKLSRRSGGWLHRLVDISYRY